MMDNSVLGESPVRRNRRERGVGLIIIVMILAFMLSVGLALTSITRSGPTVSANIRLQEEAFQAAEAGFDHAWVAIEDHFAGGAWTSFDGHYLSEPAGIDLPADLNYFRKKTDLELMAMLDQDGDGAADYPNTVYFQQPYIPGEAGLDARFTYTAFLIDDEAGGGVADPGDALLILIGIRRSGGEVTTARLEVGVAIELPGG